jgi:asparagine synthase (glutamine-hydrolysing)
MCGIAGILDHARESATERLRTSITAMTDAMLRRGPDRGGHWLDAGQGVALGHRRLSILDLSEHGNQPMSSRSERFVMTFNGEIYNFQSLRGELAALGQTFRGTSDTEVLLAGFEEWGIEKTIGKASGMFALGVWDREEASLSLVRDRLGEKPVYYGTFGKTTLFASQLDAFMKHPDWKSWRAELDPEAVREFLRHSCVPAPLSIFKNIRKLEPGQLVRIKAGEIGVPWRYWSLKEVAERGERSPDICSDEQALGALDLLLKRVVKEQMASDVPLGAFLSGGVDSSLVVAMMQSQAPSGRPVQTFTIGFNEREFPEFSEAKHAAQVARHLGTDHHEWIVGPRDALDLIPRLPGIYDEPFADASQIPTALVAQLAKTRVQVALSGDGGDESFAGYTRHQWIGALWKKFGKTPRSLRAGTAGMLSKIPTSLVSSALRPFRAVQSLPMEKFQKLLAAASAQSPEELYFNLVSHRKGTFRLPQSELESLVHRIQFYDSVDYLPNDILTKVDRASMSVSLEARAPLVDHRIVEFAWRLPLIQKVRDGKGKHLLRELLKRYVPASLTDRPKAGFAVPIGAWLRTDLREWAEDLLDEKRLESRGLVDVQEVRNDWRAHLSGEAGRHYRLWDVLMLEAWLREKNS